MKNPSIVLALASFLVVALHHKAPEELRYPITEKGNTIDIAREVAHRITNAGEEDLIFIEIQQGEYFGEDDIIRLEDDYGRV